MSRRKTPTPLTPEELDAMRDEFAAERAPIVEAYQEARRTGDGEKADQLWEHWQYLRCLEREAVREALPGIIA